MATLLLQLRFLSSVSVLKLPMALKLIRGSQRRFQSSYQTSTLSIRIEQSRDSPSITRVLNDFGVSRRQHARLTLSRSIDALEVNYSEDSQSELCHALFIHKHRLHLRPAIASKMAITLTNTAADYHHAIKFVDPERGGRSTKEDADARVIPWYHRGTNHRTAQPRILDSYHRSADPKASRAQIPPCYDSDTHPVSPPPPNPPRSSPCFPHHKIMGRHRTLPDAIPSSGVPTLPLQPRRPSRPTKAFPTMLAPDSLTRAFFHTASRNRFFVRQKQRDEYNALRIFDAFTYRRSDGGRILPFAGFSNGAAGGRGTRTAPCDDQPAYSRRSVGDAVGPVIELRGNGVDGRGSLERSNRA